MEKILKRPKNFFSLQRFEQDLVDISLGVNEDDLEHQVTEEELMLFLEHFVE